MSRLEKQLGLFQGMALLSTSLLGTGVFVVPALAATAAGAASLWAWLLLIVLVLPIAFTFAQLGRRFPHAGGAPHLIGRAFGTRLERVSAMLFLAVMPVGVPAALKIAVGFWQSVLALGSLQALAVQLGTLLVVLVLGQRPARATGLVQGLIAVAIVATIAAIWWAGRLPRADQPLLPSLDGTWHLLPAALGVMFWCFVGLEAFSHMGEEFRRPERDFPLALIAGVLLAGLLYWACSVALLTFGGYGDPVADASAVGRLFGRLLGPHAAWWMVLVGYLACFASINIYLQGFARLIWSLADEGKLPPVLARLNGHGVPGRALLLVVAVCACSLLAADALGLSLDRLIRYANGSFVVIYLLSMASGYRLLRGAWRGLALLGAVLCLAVLAMLGWQALYALALLALLLAFDRLRERGDARPAAPAEP
ncbi:L-methionine/branched-chain amino acid transporter [[Pseudomonas] boreopolis]|uniref:L-methionine/branched-chain amino acid transporter n=1 Tax=Xanthomonas boreopolis TaxID=86183 RepID=UPI003DA07BBE